MAQQQAPLKLQLERGPLLRCRHDRRPIQSVGYSLKGFIAKAAKRELLFKFPVPPLQAQGSETLGWCSEQIKKCLARPVCSCSQFLSVAARSMLERV